MGSETVYTGATNDMRIAREEVFGPVLFRLHDRTARSFVQGCAVA
jgi:acyl-CoA reductase-like NAD-dependent aldehyde dehydrogenase